MKERIHRTPKGWSEANLDDVAKWGSGGTPSRRTPKFYSGSIPWIKTGELGPKTIREAGEHITKEAIQKSSAKIFPKGSVGIAMYGATIGKLSIWGIDASTNQACAVAQPYESVLNNEFLYYFLLSEKRGLINSGKGGAQPNISQGILKDWPILLPPLNEQRRIVAKIEELFSELDKGVESLKTARAQQKTYRQAVLKHAFEGKLTAKWREENKDKLEPADKLLARIKAERQARYQKQLKDWQQAVKKWEDGGKDGKKPAKPRKPQSLREEDIEVPNLPNEWAWEHVGNLNVDVFDGPFGSNLKTSDYVDEGVRVIRLENIGYLEFIENKHSYVTEHKYDSIKKHTVHAGDIVFSSFITDGIRTVVLPSSIKRAVNKADCFCIRVHGKFIGNEFLAFFLSTRAAYKQIEGGIHGIGRPRINTTQLKCFVVPICSPQEQIEIMSQISEKLSLIENMDQSIDTELQKSEALHQSILKKAFSGQLVPQDPNDEPASVLLERIRAEKEAQAKTKAKAKKTTKRKTAA